MPSAAAWTASDIVTEVQNIGKLWRARGVTRVAEAMVDNTLKKLTAVGKLDASAAIQLYQAIDEAQLEDTLKKKLADAVDHSLLADEPDVQGAAGVGANSGQRLISVFKYLSEKDWAKIDAGNASYWSIIYATVERLKRIGIKPPMSEGTTKWAAATLTASCLERTGGMPTYEAIYQLSKDLKEALKSCPVKAHPDLQAPRVYPETPDQLGDAFMKLAYEDNDRPVERYSAKVIMLAAQHIPVRDTSKLLKKNQVGKQLTATDVARELLQLQGDGQQGRCNIQLLTKPAFGENVALQSSPVSSPTARSSPCSSPNGSDSQSIEDRAIMFQPKLRMAKSEMPPTALALTNDVDTKPEDTAEQPVTAEKTQLAGEQKTAEDYENAAFNALGVMRRPSANMSKKRPADEAGQGKPGKAKPGKTKPEKVESVSQKAKPGKPTKSSLVLGCKSCRGSPNGCKTCRKPSFGGWRGTVKQYYAQGGKAH